MSPNQQPPKRTLTNKLTLAATVVGLLAATGSGLMWSRENVIFRPDLDAFKANLETEIRVDIAEVRKETLLLRKSQLASDISIYKGAIRNIETVPWQDRTPADRKNLDIFRESLTESEEEYKDVVESISSINRIIFGFNNNR